MPAYPDHVRREMDFEADTGYCFKGNGDTFDTVEGNTNDDGSRNGYEVCRRTRSVAGKDYIIFPG